MRFSTATHNRRSHCNDAADAQALRSARAAGDSPAGEGDPFFENEEKDFPRDLSLQKAEKVREAIREIRAMTEKPELVKLEL